MHRIRPYVWVDLSRRPDRSGRVVEAGLPHLSGPETEGQNLQGTWIPPLDLSETAEEYIILVEVPGIEPEEIEVSLEGPILSLRGEKRPHRQIDEHDHYRIERRYGPFERTVRFSDNIDAERIAATTGDGLLRITLPKRSEARRRQVPVTAEPETLEGS